MKHHLLFLILLFIVGSVFYPLNTGYSQTVSPKDETIQTTGSPSASDARGAEEVSEGKGKEEKEIKSERPPEQDKNSITEEARDKDKDKKEEADTDADEDEGDVEEAEDEDYLKEEEMETIADPLKPFNSLMFDFNDKLYFYLLKPVSQAYEYVLPEPVRLSIRNFISHITTPARLVNCILQGKVEKAAIEYSRFMVNTIAGLGFFDLAKKYCDLEKQDEDLGQTLGFYGMKEVFYIVWPFFGPSTVRDTMGSIGNYFADPFVYTKSTTDIGITKINNIHSGMTVTNRVNETSLNLGIYEEFKESSIDPYVSMRNAYFELRRKKIKD
ncbi:MAG: MlaA family lipoprotein [Syntrophaceae bacterium]